MASLFLIDWAEFLPPEGRLHSGHDVIPGSSPSITAAGNAPAGAKERMLVRVTCGASRSWRLRRRGRQAPRLMAPVNSAAEDNAPTPSRRRIMC